MGKAADITFKVKLPRHIWRKLEPILRERKLTLDDFIRLYARSMVTAQEQLKSTDLGDEMPIGKYRGESLEVIIRTEPGYIRWLLANSDTFSITPEAHALLLEVTDGG